MTQDRPSTPFPATRWYDLFSRGARDWLRHNQKIRESVKQALPELVSGPDVLTQPDNRTVQVPVRFLEHYRFRLRDAGSRTGAGQGKGVKPGDVLRPRGGEGSAVGAGTGEGGLQFVLELKVEDILDWLWEELRLPNLEPKRGDSLIEPDYVREGYDKRGARSRLDRRRTLKEAVKRRAVQADPVPFTDEDLRFRQIARRPQPLAQAVVVFALDVSSSMDEWARKLAKTFFFWALQGIRRQHTRIETTFIGHTVNAWEFSEDEFFAVRGSGGTEASKAFALASRLLRERYDPARYNAYFFYASDGDNFPGDHDDARAGLRGLAELCNFIGYVETVRQVPAPRSTEMGRIVRSLATQGAAVQGYTLTGHEDVWNAIRAFFAHQAREEEADVT